jgi:hypothetical protein
MLQGLEEIFIHVVFVRPSSTSRIGTLLVPVQPAVILPSAVQLIRNGL